jgi:glycosyltransferase involved in cell wall biosynthesis
VPPADPAAARPIGRLRIAVVHGFYRSDSPSGENEMVQSQVAALRRVGHDVRLVALSSDDEVSRRRLGPLRAAVTVATGRGHDPSAEIEQWEADVVHVHNTFPVFGRRWVAELNAPVVATLHNYRPLCAAATLSRNGHHCTECIDHGRHRGLVHGCYRGSRVATLPLTLGQAGADDPLLRAAAVLTTLSEVQAEAYVRAGVPADRLRRLPNFVADDLAPASPGPGGDSWLYAGRLTSEKGIVETVRAWPDHVPLRVVGDGPARDQVAAATHGKRVTLLGRLPRAEVLQLMAHSRGLVFPSRWPDPFGLVYAEALATGTPVLATWPAAAAGMVQRDGSGIAVASVTADVVSAAHDRFLDLRIAARRAFELRYTEAAYVAALELVYGEAIGRETAAAR